MSRMLFGFLVMALCLAGCAPSPAGIAETAPSQPTATAIAPAATATVAAPPTPTPTPVLPAEPITRENVAQLAEFDRQGKGAVLDLFPVPSAEAVLVHTTRTLSLFSSEMQLLTEIPLPAAFALSPDHTLLAEVDADGNVNLRSLPDMQIVRTLTHIERRAFTRLKFSPDGSLLAVSNYGTYQTRQPDDSNLLVFSVETGELVRTLEQGDYQLVPAAVYFSPDNTYVITGGIGMIALWDFETGQVLHRMQPRSFFPEQPFHPETNQFISERDSFVFIWDPIEGRPIREYGTDFLDIRSIDWSEDYEYLSFNKGEQVRTYFDGYVATRFQAARYLYPPAFIGSALHDPAYAEHLVQLSALGYTGIPQAAALTASYTGEAWLQFGQRSGAIMPGPAGEEMGVARWQPGAGQLAPFTPAVGDGLQVYPGRDLALSCVDSKVVVYALSTGSSVSIGQCNPSSALAVSPDGTRLAVGNQTIAVYLTATGALLGELRAHEYDVSDLIFIEEGRKLISFAQAFTPSFGMDGNYWAGAELFVWTLEEPVRRLATLGGMAAEGRLVSVSPDAQHVAVAEGDRLRIWQLSNGQQLNSFVNPAAISSIAWSPSGELMALGGEEGSLHFWDWQARSLLHSVRLHTLDTTEVLLPDQTLNRFTVYRQQTSFPVLDLAFSADGAMLHSVSADGQLVTWAIP
ncbi:MAG: hypothetical protein KF698_01330 [Anaerolineales bacterium]|nr:hypothetical protein [Anaerolineales bacterium]